LIKQLRWWLQSKRQRVNPKATIDPDKTTMTDFIRHVNATTKRADAEAAATDKARQRKAAQQEAHKTSSSKEAPLAEKNEAVVKGGVGHSGAVQGEGTAAGEGGDGAAMPKLIIKEGKIVVDPASLRVEVHPPSPSICLQLAIILSCQ
jgi:hypothetical protein